MRGKNNLTPNAQDLVLKMLMDPTLVLRDQKDRIADTLAQWASRELGINQEVTHTTFTNAAMRTETLPERNVFRIRIQL